MFARLQIVEENFNAEAIEDVLSIWFESLPLF